MRSHHSMSSGTDAATTRRHSSLSAPSGSRAANSSSLDSAAGLAVAAEATSRAWASDSRPETKASRVAGSSSRRFAVSIAWTAAPTEVPVLAATQLAAERCPSSRHWLVSSTRRAASARPAAPSRSISSKASTSAPASCPLSPPGSRRATRARNDPTAARTSATPSTASPTPADRLLGGSEHMFAHPAGDVKRDATKIGELGSDSRPGATGTRTVSIEPCEHEAARSDPAPRGRA